MTAPAAMTAEQIRSAERTLGAGTWTITAGAVLYSVLTVTPLVQRVTPQGWEWTAPILPVVVDIAVVIVIRLDATVSRLGGSTGGWPAVLRWMTGLFTLLLNVGDSALDSDVVGVAVHAVAPLLLITTAEAGLSYRRKISARLDEIERSRAAEKERSRAAVEAHREQDRTDRERERAEREQAEREAREHAECRERERAEREREERREEREHAAGLERERLAAEAAERRADREAAERARRDQQQREDRQRAEQQERERHDRERAERERREQEAREAAGRTVHEPREREDRDGREHAAPRGEHPVSASVNSSERRALTAVPVNGIASEKLSEPSAREHVRFGEREGRTVRQMAEETGWSVGWVSARVREIRGDSLPPAVGGGQ
ncbi:DUF2637 domain-containing protein [Streptomyces sp. NPDC127119]|uniref:DUF2637 domain-containing protein n=1 Tax=Streptomyces sp. NPDC127119 TaxID=3345370 RepID=UPI00364593E7